MNRCDCSRYYSNNCKFCSELYLLKLYLNIYIQNNKNYKLII